MENWPESDEKQGNPEDTGEIHMPRTSKYKTRNASNKWIKNIKNTSGAPPHVEWDKHFLA